MNDNQPMNDENIASLVAARLTAEYEAELRAAEKMANENLARLTEINLSSVPPHEVYEIGMTIARLKMVRATSSKRVQKAMRKYIDKTGRAMTSLEIIALVNDLCPDALTIRFR